MDKMTLFRVNNCGGQNVYINVFRHYCRDVYDDFTCIGRLRNEEIVIHLGPRKEAWVEQKLFVWIMIMTPDGRIGWIVERGADLTADNSWQNVEKVE